MKRTLGIRRDHCGRLILCLAIAALISLILCVGIGPVFVSPATVSRMLLARLPGLGERIAVRWTEMEWDILWLTRLPRVLLGFAVGCALAVSGATMQTLVRNELADPYILGVSYGAASFATIGLVTGLFSHLGVYQNAVNGCIGALITNLLVYFYALRRGRIQIDQLLLGGIAISLFAKAVVNIVALTNPHVFLHSTAAFWTQGALAGARGAYMIWPMLLLLVCFVCLGVHYRTLNALACGVETAGTLGVPAALSQKMLLLIVSLMTGVTVGVSGGIGFVGLVSPHVARMFVGGDHRRVLPVSALMGGIFLLWCDAAARMAFAPQELPVGIVTALIGGPIFLWLLRKKTA